MPLACRSALLVASMLVLCGGTASATPAPMSRADIVANAKTVVGFSYWWGGGAWQPGSASKGTCTPNGPNGCPTCTHSGPYGADCSGFVAKAWQIDKPTPLAQNYHPFSTWHFATYSTWWDKPAKGDAKQADAFNYNSGSAGHVFMFDKGDPWGSAWAWECKGCVYGCVYNLRSVSANYGLIRRKLIVEPAACTPHCEGSVIVDANCGKGDCAAYAATCVNDNLGLRCASVFCPTQGTTSTCLPSDNNGKIATCTNGALSDVGDCGAYGAICSTAVGPAATCVSAFCATSTAAKPVAGDLCYNGKRYSCSAKGALSEAPCAAGEPCQTLPGKSGPGSGTCGPKPCDNCNDSNPCTDDSCQDGVCAHLANTAACDDGEVCTSGDACADSACHGTAKDCDDGLSCTVDACASGACSHTPDAALCEDGNACTADVCTAGGCQHSNQSGACEDGDGCTVGGGCTGGICLPGTALVCDDQNGCTADFCKNGECMNKPAPAICDDGDPCTVGDACALGFCASGPALDCADGLTCTDDGCSGGACWHNLHSGPCEDGDLCTTGDVCNGESCEGKALSCDDGLPCTLDFCSAGNCVHTFDGSKCDDGNECTSDHCASGSCSHSEQQGSCDDGDPCSKDDLCAQGSCKAGSLIACDDGLPCTLDGCTGGKCTHVSTQPQVPPTCQGKDLWIAAPCPGMVGHVEICPNDAPCFGGTCGAKDAGGSVDTASLGQVGDAKAAAKIPASSSAKDGGCHAARGGSPVWWLCVIGLGVLGLRLRRRAG